MRYVTYGASTAREAYEQTYLPRWFDIYAKQPGLGYFAAKRLDTGEFVGWFHLRDDRIESAYVELGHRLRRSAWGRGYATEGARAMVRHGFETPGLECIAARTLAANAASRHVMVKCGFELAGGFTYDQDVLACRDENERAAAKYLTPGTPGSHGRAGRPLEPRHCHRRNRTCRSRAPSSRPPSRSCCGRSRCSRGSRPRGCRR